MYVEEEEEVVVEEVEEDESAAKLANLLPRLVPVCSSGVEFVEICDTRTALCDFVINSGDNPGRALLQLAERTRPAETRDEDSDAPAFIEGKRFGQGLTLVLFSVHREHFCWTRWVVAWSFGNHNGAR